MPQPKPPTPVGRRHAEVKPNLPVFAGRLGDELEAHALLRTEGFFYYLVTMKIVVSEINRLRALKQQASLPHSAFVLAKATDQIGTGMRSDDTATYTDFVVKDPEVVNRPTTMFTRADAAHLCNLGLAGTLADACKDTPFLRDGFERLKVQAGATKLLPQQVNIGVDRKIDIMHAQLAPRMLDDGGLIFTHERVATYRKAAQEAVTAYRDEKRDEEALGLAACADCYLRTYAAADFDHRIFKRVYPEVVGLCEGTQHYRGKSHLFYR